tara:strand:- start:254 stop:1132 length:879 start_codon:yes stop_codon:yes gene_type:complete
MRFKSLLFLVFLCSISNAQDNLRLSEVVNTPLFYNPAQTSNFTTFDLFHTSRWVGFSGAPGTTLFSVQLKTEDEKVSYGGMLFDDVTGSQSQTEISGFYSYTFKALKDLRVSLGVSGGVRNIKLDNSLLLVYDKDDPVYTGNTNTILPNVGLGITLNYQDWFLSLSSPSIFTSIFTYKNDYDVVYKRRLNSYINFGRRNINLKQLEGLKMNTAVLMSSTSGAPVSLLLKNDWIYKEKLCFGLNLNYRSSIGFSFSYTLMKKYKFLYGFDYSTTDISNGLPSSSQYFMFSLQL